jgi:CRISPR-associated protein Csb2
MQIVLRQSFPLGRFHATPWRVSPFDDPHGEWPPSPFRLVRAIVARFHQLAREQGGDGEALERLVRSFVQSDVRFYLPPSAKRGPAIRQYLPGIGLEWNPAGKKDQARGAMKAPERFLAQDNCVAVPADEPLYWLLEGADWTEGALALLDACLARMTYFGRAESVTTIERLADGLPQGLEPNCELTTHRGRGAVPVLCANRDLTVAMASVETSTIDAAIPPGAVWRYAVRPPPPPRRRVVVPKKHRPQNVVQFAIGATVEPPLAAVATLTNWFRGRVLVNALTDLNDGVLTRWSNASADLRDRVASLSGKDASGRPLEGHKHARYLVWRDGGRLTRLFVHRAHPFEAWELDAILRAAGEPLRWSHTTGGWSAHLVPLDAAVPPPPGFGGGRHERWASVTPFVPARHFLDRRGRPMKGDTVPEQIADELARHGFPPATVAALEDAGWVQVHAPKRKAGEATNNARRSFHVELTFAEPVAGPIFLGHSTFYGLGLFAPALDD